MGESGTGSTVFNFYDLQCAKIMNALGNEIETGTPNVSLLFHFNFFMQKRNTDQRKPFGLIGLRAKSKITTNKIIGAHPLSC